MAVKQKIASAVSASRRLSTCLALASGRLYATWESTEEDSIAAPSPASASMIESVASTGSSVGRARSLADHDMHARLFQPQPHRRGDGPRGGQALLASLRSRQHEIESMVKEQKLMVESRSPIGSPLARGIAAPPGQVSHRPAARSRTPMGLTWWQQVSVRDAWLG